MKLDRIKVKGFKSIKEMDLELGSLNVLIGANGAGKSNFIGVFRLINQIIEENLQFYVRQAGGANVLLHYGRKKTTSLEIELFFGLNSYKAELVPSADDSLFFGDERCFFQAPNSKYDQPFQEILGRGHKESLLEERILINSSKIAEHVLDALQSWKVYHFHDTSENARIKQTNKINDNAYLKPDAANLAAFLYLLKETQRYSYERIIKVIQLAAPFFDDFVLRPSPLNPENIQLEWREKNDDGYFNASSLSDGTLRFICLATLLLQPELPATILIDEPELGLHPYAITLLAGLLESASIKSQIIISTQSVPLVNHFSPENIIVVDRKDNQSTFTPLKTRDLNLWLEDYSLGEIWEKNLIGGRPG
ncbi:MAG: AAA family ATPase [Chloroflexi bacterium]|nr:AAA family ATPase [Chloroflexota bacterium]OJW02086.1 MAG: chromosome segregation protein SMC [Chloroflexi bacterium 54-19]